MKRCSDPSPLCHAHASVPVSGHVRSHSSTQPLVSPKPNRVCQQRKINKCCTPGSAWRRPKPGGAGSSFVINSCAWRSLDAAEEGMRSCMVVFAGPCPRMNRPTIVRVGSGSGAGRIWMAGGPAKAVVGCPFGEKSPVKPGTATSCTAGRAMVDRGDVQPLTFSKPTPTILSCISLAS
jgi:hypothetical protein